MSSLSPCKSQLPSPTTEFMLAASQPTSRAYAAEILLPRHELSLGKSCKLAPSPQPSTLAAVSQNDMPSPKSSGHCCASVMIVFFRNPCKSSCRLQPAESCLTISQSDMLSCKAFVSIYAQDASEYLVTIFQLSLPKSLAVLLSRQRGQGITFLCGNGRMSTPATRYVTSIHTCRTKDPINFS